MRYIEERNAVTMTVDEFVRLAKKRVAAVPIRDEDEVLRRKPKYKYIESSLSGAVPYEVSYPFSVGEWNFEIFSDTAYEKDGHIYVSAELEGERTSPDRELEKICRAEAFVTGYVYAKNNGFSSVLLTFIYTNSIKGENTVLEERVNIGKLAAFFEKCKLAVSIYARPEAERVRDRLPTLRDMRFPYPEIRDGQRTFIHTAYRTLSRGGALVAGAPTGTGKTVSALYPALRAYGAGKCDKVFYFTPKATTAEAARDCLIRMTGCGAKIRAAIISSKENTCESGLVCRLGRGGCKNNSFSKLCDAALVLYDEGHTVVNFEIARRIARRFSVCPYELMLTYSELCDVIICDFNYLFDPDVYLRRYFSAPSAYAFLFDEAHNLPERAQKIFSAEISEDEISAPLLSEALGEFSALKIYAAEAAEKFKGILYSYLKDDIKKDSDGEDVGGTYTSEPPTELFEIFEKLTAISERELFASYLLDDELCESRTAFLKKYHRSIKKFRDILNIYDTSYQTFMFLSEGKFSAKLFLIDTGNAISKRIELGKASIFFSATLSPLHYYSSLFGLDRNAELLEVDSPFTTGQLSVSIMDKVGTRLSQRADTLDAVSKIIAATVSAKRGNYMIFSPSFAYSEALYAAFSRKYPKLNILMQKRNMTSGERTEFIQKFRNADDKSYLIGFCVMGGIYSEGIDLAGDSLIGAVIVGIGIPALSFERESMKAYFQEKYEEGTEFAYIYPGINRVLQAGGRVIRREDDYGVLVLIDDRFDDPIYKKTMPTLWRNMKFISDAKTLREELDGFWRDVSDKSDNQP